MSIKRLIGAVAMASMVTAATFQTLYALTPPPPGTPPATHTPPQNYTGIAIIDGNSAPRGTVVAASANLIPDVEGVVGANGNYSLEIPTHHHSLGYMGGMRLNFTVAGMPAVETAILGIGPVVLNLTVITPPSREERLATISSGGGHLCGLRVDGSPVCWSSSRFSPAALPQEEKFTSISSGGAYTCGLRPDGSWVCWGNSWPSLSPPPEGERFTVISIGGEHICALRSDGSPVCWGDDYWDATSPPPREKFTSISSGGNHTCALREDGFPVCWGGSYGGPDKIPPPQEKLTAISSGGLEKTCGLRPDGSPVCWGAPLGPPPAGEKFTAISMGISHVCGRRADGSVACWGDNYQGQASPPLGEKFIAITSGWGFTCGLRSDGSHICWGDSPYGQAASPADMPTPVSTPADAPTPTNSLPTDTPAPTAITPPTDTPAPTAITPPTDAPVPIASVQRQTVPPSGVLISFTSDRSELTVGDLVTLTLGVMYPENHTVVLPRIGPEWGPFEVWSQTTTQTISNGDGTKTTFRQFRVTLYAMGEFETPDLPVAIRQPDGTVEEVFPTPLRLTVNSVLTGPDEQLKDIRSPADLSTPFWERPAMIAVGALVALAALGSGGFFFYRRSRSREAFQEPLVDTRKPWEVALQELDRIQGLDLPGKGNLKGHYTLVAGTLRAYLGATYLSEPERMDATDMSSEEIEASIWQSPLDQGNAGIVIGMLQEADLVKFANYTPPASRAYEAAGQVRTLVEATRLTYEAASSQQRTSLPQGAAG